MADISPAEGIPQDAGTGTHDRLLSWREAEQRVLTNGPPPWRPGMPGFDCGAQSFRAQVVQWLRGEVKRAHGFEGKEALRRAADRIAAMKPEPPR